MKSKRSNKATVKPLSSTDSAMMNLFTDVINRLLLRRETIWFAPIYYLFARKYRTIGKQFWRSSTGWLAWQAKHSY